MYVQCIRSGSGKGGKGLISENAELSAMKIKQK